MKVLVLGGNGFIGSHLVDQLLMAGHEVRVFGHSQESFREPLTQVEYHYGDFNDKDLLSSSLEGIDAVCHLIMSSTPSSSNIDCIADVNANLVNTLQLLELMREKSVHRILYLSSGGTVYGNPNSLPVREEHALNPISSYGIVKIAIEKYLYMYRELYGFQPIILRPSNPYGARQGNVGVQGLISTILTKLQASKVFEIWGDGSVVRDYLHVEDLARLSVMALESNICGVFNAGSGKGYSINEVIELVNNIAKKSVEVEYMSARSFDVQKVILDIEQAKTQFNWKPNISLYDGVMTEFEARHLEHKSK
jgi:UDP-glucose 4-epimerase